MAYITDAYLFGQVYTFDEVRESTLVTIEVEGMWMEVYLRVPGREDREIATVINTQQLLDIKFALVRVKGLVWNRVSTR